MGNKVKLDLSLIEEMYPHFCPPMQSYVNNGYKKINPLDDHVYVDQDLIDYLYLVGELTPEAYQFFLSKVPRSEKKGFFYKIYLSIKLYFKYYKLLKKYIDPTLLREGEKMIIRRTKLCKCKNDIFIKEKDRMVSLNHPDKIIIENQYSKVKGIKIKTKKSTV
jgi:hypothetical protein